MFGLFKKKEQSLKITDRIWMSESYKLKAFAEEWKKNKETVFIFWFDETLREVEAEMAKEITEQPLLFTAREVAASHISGKPVVFAEHYPLPQKENELFERLGLKEVWIWSALNEPLFHRFGGEKIIQMMKAMGMKEDEPVEHAMISKAIRNAQEKIEKKVMLEQTAHSQKDWLQKNFPAENA
jgi:hypothetical protein